MNFLKRGNKYLLGFLVVVVILFSAEIRKVRKKKNNWKKKIKKKWKELGWWKKGLIGGTVVGIINLILIFVNIPILTMLSHWAIIPLILILDEFRLPPFTITLVIVQWSLVFLLFNYIKEKYGWKKAWVVLLLFMLLLFFCGYFLMEYLSIGGEAL